MPRKSYKPGKVVAKLRQVDRLPLPPQSIRMAGCTTQTNSAGHAAAGPLPVLN